MNSTYGPRQVFLKTLPPDRTPRRLELTTNILDRDTLSLIAFDPGVTTGWSLFVFPSKLDGKSIFSYNFETLLFNRFRWEHGQIDCVDEDFGAYMMMDICKCWPTAGVLCEDFILRTDRREKTRNLLSPVRLTAKLDHFLWRQGRRLLLQQPSLAKTTVTDDRLKIWKVYTPGLPHAKDADRHVLTFIRRCYGGQGLPMRKAAWPHMYQNKGKRENGI